ncbi:putative aminoacrylate hydrolase RutD [Diplonema papillatum]|nr:putative aminoacrylate hydrolase RutD [Diplonema papillatum]
MKPMERVDTLQSHLVSSGSSNRTFTARTRSETCTTREIDGHMVTEGFVRGHQGVYISYRCFEMLRPLSEGPQADLLQVMIVRGLGMTKEDSESFAKLLSKQGRRVVLFDNRGSGDSDAPDFEYLLDDMATDGAHVIEKTLKVPLRSGRTQTKSHLIGVSMGGCIAMKLAIQRPDLLASLTVGCSYAENLDGVGVSDRFKELSLADVPQDSLHRRNHFDELFRFNFSKRWVAKNPMRYAQLFASFEASEIRRLAKPGGRGQETAVREFMTNGMVDAVKHIACPTLLISGDEDAIIPFRNSLRLYALIENTSLAILPFQGHIFWETAPELTSQNLNPFLSMHDAV